MNDSALSEDDPSCIRKKPIPTVSEEMAESSCKAPLPTVEETLERVEKVYRSSSTDDNPATSEWYEQVLENLTRVESDCGKKPSFKPKHLKTAREMALRALSSGRIDLPRSKDEVSESETALERAKERQIRLRKTVYDHDLRGQLLMMEVSALKENFEHEMMSWEFVAKMRSTLIEMKRMELEAAQKVAVARMDMLLKMAKANEVVAQIYADMREVHYYEERACSSDDEYGDMFL